MTLEGDPPGHVLPPFMLDTALFHMENWLDSMRSRRQPNATVFDGYEHSVARIMAARAYREGRKLYWDAARESIVEEAV